MTCCDCIIKFIGVSALSLLAVCISKIVYKLVYPFFLAKTPDLHKLAGAKYAVVTGATDGIGKQFATQLAQKGFGVVLVSRSEEKLGSVKKEIEELVAGAEVETIVFDFTCSDAKEYENKIFKKLRTLEVGILVNNVGIATEAPEILHKTFGEPERSRNVSVVNTLPTTILSQEVLKQMVPRNSGIIINIGSLLGSQQFAEWSVYSSTKKYISHLSGILNKEYAPLGITIQSLTTGLVTTNLSKVKKTSFFAPNPSTYVHSALGTVGNIQETTGYFAHQLQFEFINLLPTWLIDYVIKKENTVMRKNLLRSSEHKKNN
uniref:Estradiol 17-beta-dehydrogenase 12 n=1 Tax=Rhabditophanes sp. KR3021 TaxID=114890 RepID=A0AC35THP8_9BILA